MNREIEFRAWKKKSKLMVFLTGSQDYSLALDVDEESHDIAGQGYEIMQFTGLKDKNGRRFMRGMFCARSAAGTFIRLNGARTLLCGWGEINAWTKLPPFS